MATEEFPFSAVYADPSSDEARLRCAGELGTNPRAEFIRLQIEGGRGSAKRAKALLKEHGSAWLAPLQGVLVKSSVKWARGFVVSGRVAFRNQGAALRDVPALATLERLDVSGGDLVHDRERLEAFLMQPALRHLCALDGVNGTLMPALLRARPPFSRLSRLRFQVLGGTAADRAPLVDDIAAAMGTAEGVPALRDLGVGFPQRKDATGCFRCFPRESYGWLWDTERGRQLEVLHVAVGPETLPEWYEALQDSPRALSRVELLFVNLERRGAKWRVTGSLPKSPPRWLVGTLEAALAKLPDAEVAIDGWAHVKNGGGTRED